MLLRSSSTPVPGSLLSSISDSNHNHHHHQPEVPHTAAHKHPPLPPTIPPCHNKISFHQSGPQNSTTFSCNSSPISSIVEIPGTGRSSQNGFRRAQSEGNLKSLANASSDIDEFSISNPPKKFSRRLRTIPPSFSFNNTTSSYKDSDDEEEREDFEENGELLYNNVSRGEERFTAAKVVELDTMKKKKINMGLNEEMRHVNGYGNMGLNEEMRFVNGYGNIGLNEKMRYVNEYENTSLEEAIGRDGPQMYLARGLGVGGVLDIGFGSGGGPNVGGGGRGGYSDEDNHLEEHYKRMVEENPGNPLFLRNYAEFLYQTKEDLQGAEEYYSRAILADPEDGEILSQYGKLVWELHRDEDRATSYFERAVQAASEDSHVHAAYANFLWQIKEEEEGEDDSMNYSHAVRPLLHKGAMASATV